MAVPKRRQSRARTHTRRHQHDKIPLPTVARCPACEAPLRPHHVCGVCGQYKGREVITSLLVEDGEEAIEE